MKNFLLTLLAVGALCSAVAQTTPEETQPEGYRFTDTKVLRMTPVIDIHCSSMPVSNICVFQCNSLI